MNFRKAISLRRVFFQFVSFLVSFNPHVYKRHIEFYYLNPFLNPSKFFLESEVIRMNVLTTKHLEAIIKCRFTHG